MAKAPECPVFRPTLQEVQSTTFVEYVEKLEKTKAFREAGICKIVAPEGWAPRLQGYNRLNLELPRPIRQHATGRQGLYRTLLVEEKQMRLFDFREMAAEAHNAPPKDASPEELERKFWSNVTLNPPLYAADVPGSLFDEKVKGWTLRRLRSLLSDTLDKHGIKMPGINQPYLYCGSWRSVFAWHTEDMDLHSVNYLHCGASKQWYVIPPAHRQRFEGLMRSLVQDLFRACPEFMRHKELLVSPQLLASHAIPVIKVVHNPREFVVVYPGVYHSGFNHGFNIAESVNFATKAWLPIGVAANFCECQPDSAKINMRLFSEHMSAKLRRQMEEMYATSDTEEESEAEEESEPEEEQEGASSAEDSGCCSASSEEEEGEEAGSSGSEGETAAASSGGDSPLLQQRRPRQRRRQAAGEEEEEAGGPDSQAESTSDWEPEPARPVKRARAAPVPRQQPAEAAAAATPAEAPTQQAPTSTRPQRNRRPPRRDPDMLPLRLRPPTPTPPAAAAVAEAPKRGQQQQQQQQKQAAARAAAPAAPAAAVAGRQAKEPSQQQQQQQQPAQQAQQQQEQQVARHAHQATTAGAAAARPASASRKRSRSRSGRPVIAPATAPTAKQIVGTSSRGRPLMLKVLDSAVSLLPFSYRHLA